MKELVRPLTAALIVLGLVLVGHGSGSAAADVPSFVHACGPAPAGFVTCHAVIVSNPNVGPDHPGKGGGGGGGGPSGNSTRPVANCAAGPTSGYTPCDLWSAYKLSSSTTTGPSGGTGVTVALVDAYYDPNAFSDLTTYRNTFGLPAMANCTSTPHSGPCFFQYGQDGTTTYPSRTDAGWIAEQSLDIETVSAVCPNCNIMLIDTNSSRFADLAAGENAAVSKGAAVVNNSWGGSEFSQETGSGYDGAFNHPGVAITASSGDSGYGAEYPAASPYVTAVGGTTLSRTKSGYWDESVWSGAGSGCSAYEPRPAWQNITAITGLCSNRAVADVSADANPSTGVDVYDSTRYQYVKPGWSVYGGTSVSSVIIAGLYALAGNASSVTYGSYPYSHTNSLFDISSGSNGSCGSILCNAASGWDGPTGLGTPNGTGAF